MNWGDIESSEEYVDQYDLMYEEVEDNQDDIIAELVEQQNMDLQTEKWNLIDSKIIRSKQTSYSVPSIKITVSGSKVSFGKFNATKQELLLHESSLERMETNKSFQALYGVMCTSGMCAFDGIHRSYFAVMLCAGFSGKTLDLVNPPNHNNPILKVLLQPLLTVDSESRPGCG